MKRILVAEDEDVIRDFVVINLNRMGYEVVDVPSGEDALEEYDKCGGDFDIALLDVMMPGIDGFEVCKQIRAKSNSIGIIMLSAKTQEMDKVNGLMLGADDYITKPFSPSELIARVDAVYRRVSMSRSGGDSGSQIVSGDFILNLKSRSLSKGGQAIELTQVEFQIMEFFMSNPNVAMERGEILKKVWGENYFGDVKIVDVNIRRLRMKIEEDPSSPRHILTIWGYGYKWSD
ncbi:response regulator transcription factor [Ruminococcaceae bacterium OttesenSCG-928-L11]|nr:response regulator transcription factor [Ruminococcaceae bacterium OttesenSCG-928-L11]